MKNISKFSQFLYLIKKKLYDYLHYIGYIPESKHNMLSHSVPSMS